MYVPYSSYRLRITSRSADITKPEPPESRTSCAGSSIASGSSEATLKPDKRHIYSKRVFYLDEDSWTALASDQYDARGQLYRSSFAFQSHSYDVQAPFDTTFAIYDFTRVHTTSRALFGSYDGLKYMTELPREHRLDGRCTRRRRCSLTALVGNRSFDPTGCRAMTARHLHRKQRTQTMICRARWAIAVPPR